MPLFVGIMSGTSLDGIDVALVEFENGGAFPPPWHLRGFLSIPFAQEMKGRMLAASAGEMSIRDVFRLDADLGVAFAEAALLCLEEHDVDPGEVEAIGLHGQTVWHAPEYEPAGITVQIGSAPVVAERTGIPVVSDFRSADVVAGGQGAPLVPIFDALYLGSSEVDRILLNIGGIANLTWIGRLPEGTPAGPPRDVIAFDTGPGNVLIDAAMRLLYGREYDAGGTVAASGEVDRGLLDELMSEPWLRFSPPKSTGRELFGEARGEGIVERAKAAGTLSENIVATLTEYTAATISDAVRSFCPARSDLREIIVGGGGARNAHLLERISTLAGEGTSLATSERLGIPADAKEAICFALLAWLNLEGRPGNILRVTGGEGERILGTLRDPHGRRRTRE